MGATLPKPVESAVIERQVKHGFRVGVSEINGWRTNMEDAHLIYLTEDWGFFGVFDGHGGDACSAFVAKEIRQELDTDGCPADDAAMKRLALKVDQRFLESDQPSGSTGTMCIVRKPEAEGGKHRLHVANIGDSRVLLGRIDGTIVDGNGTDGGLTTDHKPDKPSERERIYRCGGTVEAKEGNVARVNGDLAVSRAFGDREYKKTGGPGPEDRPVTADPEMGHFECGPTDFLLLVCDGVSEGNFPNAAVVSTVAQYLRDGSDLGVTARAVCLKAVEKDSKDNVTCMVVTFTDAAGPKEGEKTGVEFIPGSLASIGHKSFKTAYTAMAARAGMTLAQAAEQRYELILEELNTSPTPALQEEAAKIGTPAGSKGSEERARWFERWSEGLKEDDDDEDGPGGMDLASLMGKGKGGQGRKGGKGGKSPKGGKGQGPSEIEKEAERTENGYTWNQKGEEIQVTFKLAKKASKGNVKVAFKPSSLQVHVHGEALFDGTLFGNVEIEDCTWCLANEGSELQVMLTKTDESQHWGDLMK
jgi:serine/threonine protein phosphatase PrpC